MRRRTRLQAPITQRRLEMKRTKFDAPAPKIGQCNVDTHAIWERKQTVSDDLTPRVINILKGESYAERPAKVGRSSAKDFFNQ